MTEYPAVHVTIVTVNKKTYQKKPAGQNFTVHEWDCTAKLDGIGGDGQPYDPAIDYEGVIVKTLSDKAAEWIKPGFEYDAEIDVFKNKMKFQIPKSMYFTEDSATPRASGPAPTSKPQGPAPSTRAQSPSTRVSTPDKQGLAPSGAAQCDKMAQIQATYTCCLDYARRLGFGEASLPAVATTMFIEARKSGVTVSLDWQVPENSQVSFPTKEKVSPRETTSPEADPIDGITEEEMIRIDQILGSDIVAQTIAAGITPATLLEWKTKAGKSALMFRKMVEKELKAAQK